MKNWPGLSWPRRAGKVENVLTLGIDTATRVCSVAVCDNNKILGSLEVNVGLTHSEGLVPQLETLLKLARVEKEQLELIAVSRGPGSFTGLRIGMATAEAMAYALDLPLVAVDTLEAIAYNLPVAGVRLKPVCGQLPLGKRPSGGNGTGADRGCQGFGCPAPGRGGTGHLDGRMPSGARDG